MEHYVGLDVSIKETSICVVELSKGFPLVPDRDRRAGVAILLTSAINCQCQAHI
jgi:hypothetical protein